METPDDPLLSPLLWALVSVHITYWVGYGFILIILLVLSALISGSEVAFFSLKANQILDFENSTSKKKRRVAKLLAHPQKLLATILIANNLVNIFIITIATYLMWQVTGRNPDGVVIAYLTLFISLIIIFFGEIIPKVFANRNVEKVALSSSNIFIVMYRFFSPFSWLLMQFSPLVEKVFHRKQSHLSVEELQHALDISIEDDAVSEEQKDILKSIVNFGTYSVKQVMRSRIDIMAVDTETDFHELMNQINKNGYSRIPVYSETIDKIEGILYAKDLLPHLESDEYFEWQTLLQQVFFVPESKKIDDLFKDFQEKRVHMALVIDEYGGTSGLITLEDVIEEIVGEIRDEFDDEHEVAFHKIDKHTYIFEGKTSLNDFCKIIDSESAVFDKVKGESESLGGLLLEITSKFPHAGTKVQFDRFLFTIVSVDPRRIKKIRVHIKETNTHSS